MSSRSDDRASTKPKPAAKPFKTMLGLLVPGAEARKVAKTLVAPLPEDIDFLNTLRGSQVQPSDIRPLPKELTQFFPSDASAMDAPPPESSGIVPARHEAERDSAPASFQSEVRQIQHYEIVKKLGEGGMGVVYLARDTRLGRRVAIKVLRTRDPEITRRFIIEARTTARCTHENIVIIHDAGEFEGSPFMVLEFLEGETLSQYMQSAAPSVTRSVEIMVSVVSALARAHSEGIVHRDLKPDNIFVTASGTVKVLDFGIAKLLEHDLPQHSLGPKPAHAPQAARSPRATGIAGTVAYMSPEQWLTPEQVDHRADIWAVGLTLFELLTKQNPLMSHPTPTAVATFLAGPAPMPRLDSFGAEVPQALSEVVARCLEKSPAQRFPDAVSLLKALEPFLPGRQGSAISAEHGPFAGLRAFQEEDATKFFGRSRELGTLLGRLRDAPLLAVVGPSGVGKSSFLRAGVVPALRNGDVAWEVLTVRPGRTPILSLAEHLRPCIEVLARHQRQEPATDREVVAKLTHEPGFLGAVLRAYCRIKQTRLLMFFDQFEELYTLGATSEERRVLTAAIVGAADDAVSPVRALLSVRADFLGRATEDAEFATALSTGVFFLGPPSREGLREALVRPAEMVGYRFESPLIVSEMVEFLEGTPNGLPLLQFTAAQLWEARDPKTHQLTLASYRGMGSVQGALVSHADAVYNQLSLELQLLCRNVFMYLITPERTRAIRTMSELGKLAGNPALLKQLVGQLVDSRLWVIRAEEGEPTVEIVHESLITTWPSLRKWLEESHEDSVFIDQLVAAAHQWDQKGRRGGLLWRGEMVEELTHFQRHYEGALPAVAQEFADGVMKQERRSAWLKRTLAVSGFAVLLLMLVGVSVGLYLVAQEKKKADSNARIAQDRLAQQLQAERQRIEAERQRQEAVKTTVALKDEVKLSAEELAEKNIEIQQALTFAETERETAIKLRKQAEESEASANEAKKRAEEAKVRVEGLLSKERARAERLDAQMGGLMEDLN